MMAMKMPANSFATSWIGAQLNPFASRSPFGVSASDSERHADHARASRTQRSASSSCDAEHVERYAGFQAPLSRIAADDDGDQQRN